MCTTHGTVLKWGMSDKGKHNRDRMLFFCVAAIGLFHISGAKTPQHSHQRIRPGYYSVSAFDRFFLFDRGGSEHLAVLQLNLPDVQEKLFYSVSWPFCLALARNLLVLSQQTDWSFSPPKWLICDSCCVWAVCSFLELRLAGGWCCKSGFNQELIS